MFYKRTMPDGSIAYVEADAETLLFLTNSDREIENAERRHRYHAPYHIEALTFEGSEYADFDDPETILIRQESSRELAEALKKLTDKELTCILLVAEGYTRREIAALMGYKSKSTVRDLQTVKSYCRTATAKARTDDLKLSRRKLP